MTSPTRTVRRKKNCCSRSTSWWRPEISWWTTWSSSDSGASMDSWQVLSMQGSTDLWWRQFVSAGRWRAHDDCEGSVTKSAEVVSQLGVSVSMKDASACGSERDQTSCHWLKNFANVCFSFGFFAPATSAVDAGDEGKLSESFHFYSDTHVVQNTARCTSYCLFLVFLMQKSQTYFHFKVWCNEMGAYCRSHKCKFKTNYTYNLTAQTI